MKDYDLTVMRYEGNRNVSKRQLRINKASNRILVIVQWVCIIALFWYALT